MTDTAIRGGLWFALHRWVSLPIWLLLFFVCATGTVSVVSHEIAWLADPKVRASNPNGNPPLGFEDIAAAVKRERPGAHLLYIVDRAPYLATQVVAALPDAPSVTIYVNRYTGEVQGITAGPTFPALMRSLHGWLLVPWSSGTSLGYYLVGLLALPLLGSLITGLVIDKRFWRAFYRPRIRTDRSSRIFWSDLHRVIGVWSIWFVALIALTGLWYLTQGALLDAEVAFEPPPPMIAREALPTAPAGAPPRVGLDETVAAARAAIPDLDVRWIFLPDTAYNHTTVYGKGGFPLLSDFALAAHVNPYTGEIASARDVGSLTPIQWIDHMADPLHYGDFGGLWSKAVWFLFGVGLSAMVLSGAIVWLKRTAKLPARLRQQGVGKRAAMESD